jgi:hypothetical protein
MLGVPTSSPFWQFLLQTRDDPRWLVYTPGQSRHRYLYIDMSMSYGEYLGKFKTRTLQTFRRKLRLLEKELGSRLELARVCSPDHVAYFLACARPIAEKSWQRHLIDLDVDQPADRQGVLESMAREGMLRSYLLRSGDRILAFLVGFQLNGSFYFHETAYDSAWARFSPGQSLLYLIIKDCFEVDAPQRFYFGTGEAYYKHLFANRVGDEVTLMILKRNAANHAKIMSHQLFRKSIELLRSLGRQAQQRN